MTSSRPTQGAAIGVVLPVYNESAALGDLLKDIHAALDGHGFRHEIVVVDDGSTDGSAEIADRAGEQVPVRVIRHERNGGYGEALRTGLSDASDRASIVVTMDADGTHDPGLIPALAAEVANGCDVAIASRFQPGGQEIGVPWNRLLLSHGARWVFGVVFREKNVRDYTSGYRAYRAGLIRDILRDGVPVEFPSQPGFTAGLELLLRAGDGGARFSEVPLVLRYDQKRSASKLKVWRTLRQYAALTGARKLSRVNN